MPIVTSTVFRPEEGRRADLVDLLFELRRQIRGEAGNLEYSIHRALDAGDPGILVIQAFESEDAFAAHAAKMAEIGAPGRLADLIAGPLDRPKLFESMDDSTFTLGGR